MGYTGADLDPRTETTSMIPRRLSLLGLTRFTTEVSVDLDQLPDGLIAVTGPNGSGKTTIMEALAPAALYLEFPSRPGNIQGRANRRDAHLDLVVDFAGRTWRHLVQVDPGTGRSGAKTEAYLWELAPGAELPALGEDPPPGTWLPVDGYPTPGRSRDYHQALEALGFPSRDVFLAGPFSVHTGAGNFLELDVAKRRELFVTLLGLGELERLSERAKLARQPLDAALVQLEDLAAELERDRQASAELHAELVATEAKLAAAAKAVQRLEVTEAQAAEAATKAQAELETLETTRTKALARQAELEADVARLEARVKDLSGKITEDQAVVADADGIRQRAARRAELTERRATLLGERQGHLATRESASRELHQARQELGRHGDRRRRLEAELAELNRKAQALEDVHRRMKAKGTLAEDQAALEAARREVREARQSAPRLEAAHREAQAQAPSVEAVEAKLARLERDAGLLGDVPCGGRTVALYSEVDQAGPVGFGEPTFRDCGDCQFLAQARQAAVELPAVRLELEAAEAKAVEVAQLYAMAQEGRAKVAELEARAERQAEGVRELERLEAEATRHREALVRRPRVLEDLEALNAEGVELTTKRIPALETKVAEASAAMDQVDTEGREIRQELDGPLDGADHQARSLEVALGRLPERRQALEDAQGALERQRAALAAVELPPEPVEARERHQGLEATRRQAKASTTAEREAQAQLREALGRVRGRLDELGDLVARGQALEDARGDLDRRRTGFREIERAMGRTGLQVLEIDAAGPEVARLTNDLLSATYGGRFAVRLDTTRTGSRGQTLETFDLVVLDGNRKARAEDSSGGGRLEARERLAADVSELSKGEKVLIDEALKLGIAMFHAQRSGAEVLTLWRDECDTGLDPANRRRYPAMLRRALELGGFRRIYFVSHDQDVQAQADGVLRVSGPTEAAAVRVESAA